MATCGSGGAAIDRAVAALSGHSTSAGKHVSSLLGHAAVAHQQPAMPMVAPAQLYDHSTTTFPTMVPIPESHMILAEQQRHHHHHVSVLDQAWSQNHPQATQMPQQLQNPLMQQHQMMMQHEHMRQMQFMIHQQQQHLQNQYAHLQRQQIEKQEQQIHELESEKTVEPKFDNWDEALYDDIAQGATIEDMAAAWAEAEAEYERENAAVNLASVYTNDMDQYEYHFQNPSTEAHQDEHDWMQLGLEEFNRGNLTEAIRAFETLVRMQDDHATAWYYLGKCHAENDLDMQAIVCLERSAERDPFSPETLLALGVSYVNELNHKKALKNLKEWITHNPKFAGLTSDDLYGGGSDESELDQVQGLLLRALEYEPSPDVHEALGIVYNVSRDYDAAVACFERAVSLRPRDYSLWNKLGATLANSNASDRALPAYREALKLRPRYARAWLNMAISHSNLKKYDQAARCYLQTLSLNPSATHCWSYLRIALSCQEQWDLLPLVSAQDIKAFREHYDFVLYRYE